ncbi:MAG: hypothetical protein JWR40_1320 [Massilia sp.]|jgi:hypothetical protein|nr:hypothetical protein [Massilia sp.]MDB5948563.1 hypothetical protein [Massilia sp.]
MESQIVAVKDKPDDAAERKAQLIRQGEFHRVGVMHAKAQVKQAARPEALFHSAIDHATWAVRSRVDNLLHPTGTSVGALMPYALTIFRFIRHRRIGKASLGVAVVLAGVGFYIQQRRARQSVYE